MGMVCYQPFAPRYIWWQRDSVALGSCHVDAPLSANPCARECSKEHREVQWYRERVSEQEGSRFIGSCHFHPTLIKWAKHNDNQSMNNNPDPCCDTKFHSQSKEFINSQVEAPSAFPGKKQHDGPSIRIASSLALFLAKISTTEWYLFEPLFVFFSKQIGKVASVRS